MHSEKELDAIRQTMDEGKKVVPTNNIIGRYPKIKRGERIYVRYPVQIQKMDLGKTAGKLKVGKWMAVNVHLPEGYTRLIAPAQYDTEAECQKACDMYNDYHKFTKRQVLAIISASMKASIERGNNEK